MLSEFIGGGGNWHKYFYGPDVRHIGENNQAVPISPAQEDSWVWVEGKFGWYRRRQFGGDLREARSEEGAGSQNSGTCLH